MEKKEMLIFFALFIMVLFCTQCAEIERSRLDELDNGLMTNMDGEQLSPYILPWQIVLDDTISDKDKKNVYEVAWWFNATASRDGVDRLLFLVSDDAVPGDRGVVLLTIGYPGAWADGSFEFYWSHDVILHGTITISSDVSYNESVFKAILKHELGHSLGLADDPGPPVTVDLNSIMSSPMVHDGDLTHHDWLLVVGG